MLARNQYKVWLRRRTGSIRAASDDLDLHGYSFGIERGRKEMIWNDDDDEFSMYLCLFLFFSELVTPLFGDWRAVWSSWSMNDLPHIRSGQKKKVHSKRESNWLISFCASSSSSSSSMCLPIISLTAWPVSNRELRGESPDSRLGFIINGWRLGRVTSFCPGRVVFWFSSSLDRVLSRWIDS